MTKRIFFSLVLLGAVFYAPWWVVSTFAFVGAFLFPFYYEIIAVGVLFDILYGISIPMVRGVLGLVVATVLFIIACRLKRVVRS